MKTIPVSSRPVSSLILGTDYFGATVSREESFALLDRFLALGGNAVDTARLYASWLPGCRGASEETIGAWMRSRKNREGVFLITKGGAVDKGSTERARLSPEDLRYDLTESLRALQTDAVDRYFLHRDDEERPVEEIMPTLDSFVKEGKVRAIGASNWRAERIRKANGFAVSEGLTPFTVSEIQWSLARSTPALHGDESLVCMNEEEYAFYAEGGMPVFAFSSQAKGFFLRGAKGGTASNNRKALARFGSEENLRRLERVIALAERKGMTVAEVTLGFITSHAFPAAALIGCKNLDQLEESMKAGDAVLTEEELDYLTLGKPL